MNICRTFLLAPSFCGVVSNTKCVIAHECHQILRTLLPVSIFGDVHCMQQGTITRILIVCLNYGVFVRSRPRCALRPQRASSQAYAVRTAHARTRPSQTTPCATMATRPPTLIAATMASVSAQTRAWGRRAFPCRSAMSLASATAGRAPTLRNQPVGRLSCNHLFLAPGRTQNTWR